MTPDLVIDKLIDIVSKNGNMLLNIPIKADGTIDREATALLKNIGKWFQINGEAIYGTRPWYMHGEGHNAKRKPVVFPNLVKTNTRIGEITHVELLGYEGELEWYNHGDGLQVYFPKEKPCNYAYALKISFL